MLRLMSALCVFAALTACGETSTYLQESLSTSATALPFTDGNERFDLYKIEQSETPSEIAFFIGGSGCASLSVYLAPYFNALSPEIMV